MSDFYAGLCDTLNGALSEAVRQRDAIAIERDRLKKELEQIPATIWWMEQRLTAYEQKYGSLS